MVKRNIYLLSLFNFFCDFVPYAPIAVIYFYQITHSYALSMSIFSITMLGSAVFEVPTGILSDRVGRKLTIIYGAVFKIISVFLYSVAPSYFILAIGALLEGISRSFYSGNNDALLYESLGDEKHEFAKHQGRVSGLFQIGLAVSAILGSILSLWSLSVIFWIAIIPQIIAFVVALYIREPKRKSEITGNIYDHLILSLNYSFSHKKLRLINIASAIRYAVGESMYQFRSTFYATLLPIWALGILSTMSNIFAFLGSYLSHRFVKRLGLVKSLVFEIITNRIIVFVALLFQTIFSPMLMTSTSFFWGLGQVSLDTILQREFTEKERATLGSINSFLGNILFGIFSIMVGFLGDKVGIVPTLIIGQLITLTTLIFYLQFYKLEKIKK